MQIGSVNLGVVDLVALAVLILFFVRGLFKGFVSQLAGVIILAGGLAVARYMGPQITSFVDGVMPSSSSPELDLYIGYFVVFIAFMIIVGILSKMLRGVIEGLRLQSYDRLLGGIFGTGLGAFVVFVLLVISVLFLPYVFEESKIKQTMANAYTPRYAARVVSHLNPFFPVEVREEMNRFAKEITDMVPDEPEASADEGK